MGPFGFVGVHLACPRSAPAPPRYGLGSASALPGRTAWASAQAQSSLSKHRPSLRLGTARTRLLHGGTCKSIDVPPQAAPRWQQDREGQWPPPRRPEWTQNAFKIAYNAANMTQDGTRGI